MMAGPGKRFVLALVGLLGILAAPTATLAQQIINPSSTVIPLEVRKGSLVQLKQPATNIFVTNPKIADVQVKSPRLFYIMGKEPGETSVYALSADDKVLFNAVISVKPNLSRLKQAFSKFLPAATLTLTSVDGTLLITGQVDSSQEAEDVRRLTRSFVGKKAPIMNRVSVQGPNQINLRVRIAEVSRNVLKQLGFNWDSGFGGLNGLIGIATGAPTNMMTQNPLSSLSMFPRANLGVPLANVIDPITGRTFQTTVGSAFQNMNRQFLTRNNGTNSIVGSLTKGALDLNVVIDALETNGLISILAEPNLTAMSGETASFLAGGEFPIPVPQQNNVITIAYRKFGVGLAFTPTVRADSSINLRVAPEVSQLTAVGALMLNGFSIPGLTVRRAETTVELASGQSFAIAGLLQNNITKDLNKVPGLGDLPILGPLFRSDSFKREETELVIIVTPYLVRPVSRQKMLTPSDGYRAPNDMERVIAGVNYRQRPLAPKPDPSDAQGRKMVGPAGFMLQ